MTGHLSKLSIYLALAALTLVFAVEPASAITAELAKKCRDMALKAHPPERPGKKSHQAEAERTYFRECVEKNGNMPE